MAMAPYAPGQPTNQRPRLVVVVSFDQFRGDYPERFEQAYPTNGGFKRMLLGGAVYSACRYNHANNITGPGHATLLTGCYPDRTGIVGNDFCNTQTGRCGYCAQDTLGVFGPHNLLVPTLGDRLRAKSPSSKVIGLALKDRAAILMAGKSATACVWYDHMARKWTSSKAYPQPRWLPHLNATINVDRFEGAVWNPLVPDSPTAPMDSVAEEGTFPGGTSAFPHHVLAPSHPKFIASVLISPFSMEMLFDAALEVIDREKMGRDDHPDLLCIGVSTTDYVGHVFGPDSREVMDMYARADRHMGHLIDHLDRVVGRSQYVIVVTSDHGVAPIPEVIRRQAEQQRAVVDAGRIREAEIQVRVDSALSAMLGTLSAGTSYVREIFEPSIYLNWSLIPEGQRKQAVDEAVRAVASHRGIGIAVTSDALLRGKRPGSIDPQTWAFIRNSTFPGRTGDIVMYPKQYWVIGGNVATHGTPYDYDRWVPLMWYGGIIAPHRTDVPCAPVDIAPTLAAMLRVDMGPVEGTAIQLKLRKPVSDSRGDSVAPQRNTGRPRTPTSKSR